MSDNNNESEFVKLKTSDQASKTTTFKTDAGVSDKMASRHMASPDIEMASQNVAQNDVKVAEFPPWKTVDLLAVRKAAIYAHNVASKGVAKNDNQLFARKVETPEDPVVASQTAVARDESSTQADVHGGGIPSQYGGAVRDKTTLKGVANDGAYIVAGAGYKMSASAGYKMAVDGGYKMAAGARDKMAAGTGAKMAAGAGDKMAAGTGAKMAAGAGEKVAPPPQRSSTGGFHEVELGTPGANFRHESSVTFTTHVSGQCGRRDARPDVVRTSLCRLTLQGLLCMVLAMFLTYFAMHFMERYLRPKEQPPQ